MKTNSIWLRDPFYVEPLLPKTDEEALQFPFKYFNSDCYRVHGAKHDQDGLQFLIYLNNEHLVGFFFLSSRYFKDVR